MFLVLSIVFIRLSDMVAGQPRSSDDQALPGDPRVPVLARTALSLTRLADLRSQSRGRVPDPLMKEGGNVSRVTHRRQRGTDVLQPVLRV